MQVGDRVVLTRTNSVDTASNIGSGYVRKVYRIINAVVVDTGDRTRFVRLDDPYIQVGITFPEIKRGKVTLRRVNDHNGS